MPQLNDETMLNAVYAKSSLFGSSTSLRVQTYYYKSFSIFQYTVDRFTLLPAGPDQNGQSENDTHKLGARADFNTNLSFLPFNGTLLWGVDYMQDHTVIPLVDGRAFGIPQRLSSIAGFAQLQFKPIDPLTLTVGVRREHDELDVSNFYSLFTLVNVTGGKLPYDATPVNTGLVYNLTHSLDLFGGYSQGFNIQQTSQTFRSWPVSIDLATQKPPPNVVDSFEGGLRWHGNGVTASATGFYNKSSDAIAYSYNPEFPQDPSSSFTPDRVWGTEIESAVSLGREVGSRPELHLDERQRADQGRLVSHCRTAIFRPRRSTPICSTRSRPIHMSGFRPCFPDPATPSPMRCRTPSMRASIIPTPSPTFPPSSICRTSTATIFQAISR